MLYDLIIIGSGPAGITAAIYAVRKKLKTLLITRDFVGQVGKISEIENWPGEEKISGMELMEKLSNHLKKFEIEIEEGDEVKEIKKTGDIFEIRTKRGDGIKGRAVIITSGRTPRLLGVAGEKEFLGKGVSTCSICDAPFFKDKLVAVIGGGNAGFRTALDLVSYAKEIYIFEASSKLGADEVFQEKAKNSGKVEIIFNAQVLEIKGREGVPKSRQVGTGIPAEGLGIEKIIYKDLISQEQKEFPLEGVFIEIGSIPATNFVRNLVDFSKTGDIMINPKTLETKTPGLFAAGDVADLAYKQLIIAAGEGAKAALSAYNYLQTK